MRATFCTMLAALWCATAPPSFAAPVVAAGPPGDGGAQAPLAEVQQGVSRSIVLGGRAIRYRATAGTLTLRNDEGRPVASMFYVAYVADRPPGSPERPVTFLFNGGPGSASLWLNIGGFGPVRPRTATPQATPPAPYVLESNASSLLDHTDLVFLDAIGTGYSRALGSANAQQFWGVDGDIDIFARGIVRYVELNDRWNSPKFLLGESYGTTRAAGLAYKLHVEDIDLNGVILMSSVLNFAREAPGLDEDFIDILPTYAAAAFVHGRAAAAGADEAAFLQSARVFARGPYAAALAKGDRLAPEEEDTVARQMSGFVGLRPETLKQAHLRIDMEDFRKMLLKDQGLTIGRFDARFTGPGSGGVGQYDPATNDPATAGVNGAYLAAFRQEIGQDIGYRTDLAYRALYNGVIEPRWDMHHKAPGIDEPLVTPDTALDLAAAMGAEPQLKVLSINGLYDLSTPFFGAEYDLSHMLLAPELRKNIDIRYYQSGHQTYADPRALVQLKADIAHFYDSAVGR